VQGIEQGDSEKNTDAALLWNKDEGKTEDPLSNASDANAGNKAEEIPTTNVSAKCA